MTDTVWSEAQHELPRRLGAMGRHGQLPGPSVDELRQELLDLVARQMRIVPATGYGHMDAAARQRVPRDPDDWLTVALALALGADIWTHDYDFLGCGIATWTTETLLLHLTV